MALVMSNSQHRVNGKKRKRMGTPICEGLRSSKTDEHQRRGIKVLGTRLSTHPILGNEVMGGDTTNLREHPPLRQVLQVFRPLVLWNKAVGGH